MASFFSMMFVASRILFALSRGSYFGRIFDAVSENGAPAPALLFVAASGLAVSSLAPEDVLVEVAMLLASTYFLTVLAFIVLRIRMPELARPYRAPGGIPMASALAVLIVATIAACFQLSWQVVLGVVVLLMWGCVAYLTCRR